MNLEGRLKKFKEKGYTYNSETGEMFSHIGKLISGKSGYYIKCTIRDGKNILNVLSHQLAWYLTYNEVPNIIDHINQNKLDNRITNLRNTNYVVNNHNKISQGYYLTKSGKYYLQLQINGVRTNKTYNTEEEAKKAFSNAKKIIINFE